MSLRALVVRKEGDSISRAVETLDEDALPEGEVTVDVEYSTINYKDGLCLTGERGLVRNFPHVPGIDFAGTVRASSEDRFKPGDKVVLTGWGVGENRWGGYASRARVKAGWLVPLPDGLSTRQAMAVGTAGLTAMLAIMALEEHGLMLGAGEVLVTGASGGVGSVAVALLAAMGYEAAAVTGRPENADYLRRLGARTIIPRADLAEPSPQPLESERWAGCIDSVGGVMMARVLAQLRYGGSIASVGLAGGAELPATVLPFLLRGVNILGIDSVYQPLQRRLTAWERLARTLPPALLDMATHEVSLEEVVDLGDDILQGKLTGRTVVRLNGG